MVTAGLVTAARVHGGSESGRVRSQKQAQGMFACGFLGPNIDFVTPDMRDGWVMIAPRLSIFVLCLFSVCCMYILFDGWM